MCYLHYDITSNSANDASAWFDTAGLTRTKPVKELLDVQKE